MSNSVAMIEAQELVLFVEVCRDGHQHSRHSVEIIDILKDLDSYKTTDKLYSTTEEYKSARARATELGKVAEAQEKAGFPMLYGLAIVRLVTIIESAIERFVVSVLKTPSKWKDQKLIRSLEGPLIEFSELPPDQQSEYLYGLLRDAVKPKRHTGIGRYEALLEPVGLGGGVPDGVRRALFELIEVRNLIVHKASIVDATFMNACNWLNTSIGTRFDVTAARFSLYVLAANWYFLELERRSENPEALTANVASAMSRFADRVSEGFDEVTLSGVS